MTQGGDIDERALPRYAVYFCPCSSSPLWQFGSSTLGYDAQLGCPVSFPRTDAASHCDFDNWSRTPRRYGFHATLKAPFRLADGATEARLLAEADAFAREATGIELGRLEVAPLGAFVALLPSHPPPALATLAAACVDRFEPFRRAMSAAERSRRLSKGLTRRQTELLDAFGYPFVHDAFRFHMTLTGPLEEGERRNALGALAALYAPIDEPVVINAIAVVWQAHADDAFKILKRCPFGL